MVCPRCKYSHDEYDFETKETSKGKLGSFYKLPIQLEKHEFFDVSRENVHGCPSCKIVFMGGI